MLKEARESSSGRAWLLTDTVQKTLIVKAWSERPASSGLSFFAPDFALNDSQPWLTGESTEWTPFGSETLPSLVHRVEPSSADFERHHEEILRRISAHEFEKVVPIVCEDLEFAAPLKASMFHVAKKPGQFTYGFEFNGDGMTGRTPELLFKVHDGVLKTMALAGTGKADGPSLLDDKKERHEHQLVIEHIASELASWGTASVGTTTERVYGKLKHLHTPIEIKLSDLPSFLEIVVRLHPTAALGGWPRKPAIEWLQMQDYHSTRKRFGAPFGFQDGERMTCVVAIRGIQWWKSCARIAAGCGVVQESQPLNEWNELKLKREAIYQLLDFQA